MTTLTHAIYSSRNMNYFTIIRPLLTDENGEYTGKYYKGTCIGSSNVTNYKVSVSLEEYSLNEDAKTRLKYNGIEVEQTVNVFNNSVVNLGDELIYSINITNNSKENYYDLNVVKTFQKVLQLLILIME